MGRGPNERQRPPPKEASSVSSALVLARTALPAQLPTDSWTRLPSRGDQVASRLLRPNLRQRPHQRSRGFHCWGRRVTTNATASGCQPRCSMAVDQTDGLASKGGESFTNQSRRPPLLEPLLILGEAVAQSNRIDCAQKKRGHQRKAQALGPAHTLRALRILLKLHIQERQCLPLLQRSS